MFLSRKCVFISINTIIEVSPTRRLCLKMRYNPQMTILKTKNDNRRSHFGIFNHTYIEKWFSFSCWRNYFWHIKGASLGPSTAATKAAEGAAEELVPKAKRQKCELMGWKPKMQIHDVYKQETVCIYIWFIWYWTTGTLKVGSGTLFSAFRYGHLGVPWCRKKMVSLFHPKSWQLSK